MMPTVMGLSMARPCGRHRESTDPTDPDGITDQRLDLALGRTVKTGVAM